MKSYVSILDQISQQLEKEGHTAYKTSFNDDRAFFNLPPEMRPITKNQQSISDSPVSGDRFKPHSNDKQFSDANKQLNLPGSSTIQSAAYWPTKNYLLVSFKSGHTYSYDKVPIETVLNWEQASSAGSFFYYNIRMSYRYQKQG